MVSMFRWWDMGKGVSHIRAVGNQLLEFRGTASENGGITDNKSSLTVEITG